MKTSKLIALLCFVLFGFSSVHAQYGYGNPGGYGNNGYGNNGYGGTMNQQSMQNTNNFGRSDRSPEVIEKEKAERVNKAVDKLTKELALDDLQVIVIRKEIESAAVKTYKVVKNEETSDDEKVKEVQAINEGMDITIMTFLNDTQKTKYKNLVEERNMKIDNYRNKK